MTRIWHGYVLVTLVESDTMPLSDAVRRVIRTTMATLNIPWDGAQPADLFQARLSNDGTQAIYELTADLDATTPQAAFARIAAALRVDAAVLQAAIRYRFFAPGGTYQHSLRAAQAYLIAHAPEWEDTRNV